MAKKEKVVVKFKVDTPDGFKKGDAVRVYPRLASELLSRGLVEDYREKEPKAAKPKEPKAGKA